GTVSMRTVKHFLLALLAVGLLGVVAFQAPAQKDDAKKDDPKFTIKEVMAKAHKSELFKKMIDSSISADEKKQLTELYLALSKNKPPQGDERSWKEKTEAINKAMKDDDAKAFAKALNCMECHKAHRPPKDK